MAPAVGAARGRMLQFHPGLAERQVRSLAPCHPCEADSAHRLHLRQDTLQKTWRQTLQRAQHGWPAAA